jgi:hypothetical protein
MVQSYSLCKEIGRVQKFFVRSEKAYQRESERSMADLYRDTIRLWHVQSTVLPSITHKQIHCHPNKLFPSSTADELFITHSPNLII